MWWLRERNRKRGGGEEREKKKSHAVDEQKHKLQRERHKARPASVAQSYSSVLILFLPKPKDIHRTANCAHLTQKSG